eukprot:scaffold3043_cov180-Amphora_coffeaeformis.AAC.27
MATASSGNATAGLAAATPGLAQSRSSSSSTSSRACVVVVDTRLERTGCAQRRCRRRRRRRRFGILLGCGGLLGLIRVGGLLLLVLTHDIDISDRGVESRRLRRIVSYRTVLYNMVWYGCSRFLLGSVAHWLTDWPTRYGR